MIYIEGGYIKTVNIACLGHKHFALLIPTKLRTL